MKRAISLFFVFLMIISLYQSTNALAIDGGLNLEAEETVLVSDNIYNKIHFYLDIDEYNTIDNREELVSATNYAVKNYAIGQYEQASTRSEQFNSYQVTVEFASDFMNTDVYKALMAERETMNTIEEIHEFRSRLNSYSKEYHSQLVSKSMKFIDGMEYSKSDPITYSPFVVLDTPINNVTVDALLNMALQSNIVNISVASFDEELDELPPIEVPFDEPTIIDPNSWEKMLRDINAYDIVTNGTLTGNGIRIGILEAGGVCDISNQGLIGVDITLKHKNPIALSNHATAVTLIASQIAPDAKYFVSDVFTNKYLEWFIDNNCDIVNCSFGLFDTRKNNDGTYVGTNFEYRCDWDGVFDYQIKTHKIVVVKSAGNKVTSNRNIAYNPNSKVTSPGYAFNAITVGGATRNTSNQLIHHSLSCYISNYPSTKPNVAAKFKIIDVPNYTSIDSNGNITHEFGGTSAATPQVTGCIALLMQYNSRFIDKPEIIMSLISSCARETDDYSAEICTSLDNKVGAGIIDFGRMLDNLNYTSIYNANGEDSDTIFSRNVYLNAGDEIQISIAWLAGINATENDNDITAGETYITDYDLVLYYYNPNFSNGYVIESQSSCMDNNVEMIRCTISISGTYTIAVEQYGNIHQNMNGDDIALTYNIE